MVMKTHAILGRIAIRACAAVTLALAMSLLLSACGKKEDISQTPPPIEVSGSTMGTTWRLTILDADGPRAKELVHVRLNELEAIFTNWRADSAVSRFNASRTTEWQPIPRELAEVMTLAQRVSKESHGAFDVTMAPLINAWGFGPQGRQAQLPDESVVAKLMRNCGWQKIEVELEPPMLRKTHPEVEINVSALVEGYAVDDLVKKLRAQGWPNFLLDVGGELYASGKKPHENYWQVGVQKPDAQKGMMEGSMPLHDKALATSGTYRQFVEKDGKRLPHVLDARFGRPVEHDLVSVSVVADSCFEADAWATALLILGPWEGRELAKRVGLDALFLAQSRNPTSPSPSPGP